jgi:hypothetical protein
MIKSIKIGNKAEQKLIELLASYGFTSQKNNDKATRSFFDVSAEILGKTVTFEVKYDVMSKKTGNLAIEYYNPKSDKDSGLMVTKADFWVHCYDDDNDNILIKICKVSDLKDFCANNMPCRDVKSCGDNNSNMLIFKKERLTCLKDISLEFFS